MIAPDATLTHDALERSSAAWAGVAASRVRGDGRVGICFDRSASMVVAILAAMRAGAAYVPIDPAWPTDRVRWLLQDAGVDLVFAGAGEPAELARRAGAADVVVLDHRRCPAEPLKGTQARADGLAYLIYTSGSTGRPKGVMIEHRQAVVSTLARRVVYSEPPARYLLLSPVVFDSSVAGLFWPLVAGGSVVLPRAGAERDPDELARVIERERITHTLCLPSLHAMLLERLRGRDLALRVVIVAGEACPAAVVAAHHDALPGVRLFNEYGPTEAAVWSTVDELRPGERDPVPIGRPVPHARVHVVGPDLGLLPRGAVGEVVVAGPGLARGYWNREDITAAGFVRGPFRDLAEDRIYRTGDLARWTADGRLVFIGRADDQVKLRGYRIELGEIETHLVRAARGAPAAVVVRGEGDDRRLVGYVGGRNGTAPDPAGLRAALQAELPAYMVPGAFVVLPELPLTSTGKVDRNALRSRPWPDGAAGGATASAAPSSGTERALAAIWADLLRVTAPGVDDDFFALGGHSFLAVRLFARIEARFGCALSVATLFRAPTIGALAVLIDQAGGGRAADEPGADGLVVMRPGGPAAPLFCVHPRDGGVLIYRQLAARLPPGFPILGIEAPAKTGASEDFSTIEAMARAYLPRLLAAQPKGRPFRLCGFSMGGLIALELGRLLEARGETVAFVGLLDTHNPARPPRRMGPFERWRPRVRRRAGEASGAYALRLAQVAAGTVVAITAAAADRARAAYLRRRYGAEGAMPVEFRHLDARERNDRATFAYRPAPYAGSVVLFRAGDADDGYCRSADLGWREVVGGNLEIVAVAGDHMTFLVEPHVDRLAAALAASLAV